jgi:DNA-binding winged helix-turn-helix (wHTH) protein
MVSLPHNKYQIGQCLINCQDLTISKGEKTVQLPAKVFEFLKLLIKNYGQTVTKEQAIEQIWMNNIEVGKRGAGNAIWHLRKSFTELDVEPSDIFRTITKVGYVLLLEPFPIFSVAFKTNIETVEVKTINNKKRTKTRFAIGIISLLIAITYIYSEKFLTENKSSKKYTTEIERITNFEGVEELPSISKDGQYMTF